MFCRQEVRLELHLEISQCLTVYKDLLETSAHFSLVLVDSSISVVVLFQYYYGLLEKFMRD